MHGLQPFVRSGTHLLVYFETFHRPISKEEVNYMGCQLPFAPFQNLSSSQTAAAF